MKKWYRYQKERFPLWFYLPIAALFAASTMAFTYGREAFPNQIDKFWYLWFMVAAYFVLLRIADEHKDYEKDCREHSDRPVQRGEITLKELRRAGIIVFLIQVSWTAIKYQFTWRIQYVVILYFLLMMKEFYLTEFLEHHPLFYIALHQVIFILIDYLIIITCLENYHIILTKEFMYYVIGRCLFFFSVFMFREMKWRRLGNVMFFLVGLLMAATCLMCSLCRRIA